MAQDLKRAMMMTTFKGRLELAALESVAMEKAKKSDLANDPWFAPIYRMKGIPDFDGHEYITSQQILDELGVPVTPRDAKLFRRLSKIMAAHGWEAIRVRESAPAGGAVTDRVRGYRRRTNRSPVNVSSKEGKGDTSTSYVMSHVVARLEADRRYALGRSVRALVAERNALQEKLAAANDFATQKHLPTIDADDDDFAEAQRLAETVLGNGDEDWAVNP